MVTLKRLSFLFITLFLFACNSSDLDHDTTIKNDVTIKSNNMLTIETVEFSGTNAVRNVGVKLIDNITGEQLAKAVSNDEGKVHFKQLEQKKRYKLILHEILPSGEWHEQLSKEIVYDENNPIVTIETFHPNKKTPLNVPVVLQNPELPNGCEITALAAVLNYFGIKVDKVKLAKEYLPTEKVVKKGNNLYGPDPNVAYAGNPFDKLDSFYVFPLPIVEVANKILIENNSMLRAIDMPNTSKEEIIHFVQSGVPVITWITIDLKKPKRNHYWIIQETKEKHFFYSNLHVVVVTGYRNGKVTVMNPLIGQEEIDEDVFFNSFQSMGSQCVVIL